MALETYDSIFQQFPSVSPVEWKAIIIKDLKGASFDNLIYHSKEGIEILPFYTKEDNKKFQLKIPDKLTNAWGIAEKIIVDEIELANQQALLALEMGSNLLYFDLQNIHRNASDINKLLKNIVTDAITIQFENYLVEDKQHLNKIIINSCPGVVVIPELETISDELTFALVNGIQNKSEILWFHFSVRQNYFFEIAKLRAFRWLWKQVADLKNISSDIFINCNTSVNNFPDVEDYSNILRNTTSAMSAILGGCDSLFIHSHDVKTGNTSFGKRIGINIHHILQYESYFNEINDATKGAYYIEYLTYQLAKKSWDKFIVNK